MPIIPFNMPRNDMLSFAGDEHHFHILGFSWSTGSPELSLLPLRRDGNDLTGDRTPFDIDLRDMDDISFRFSGPPVCIGRFEEGEHIPCPGTREVNRFSQCMECMTHDIPDPNCIFEPHCHTGPCGADFCQVEHVVYITAFRSRMKIGMTQHRRMRTRAMEQGADGMLPLIILKDRFSARSYEGAISRTLGLPQMVSSYEKVQSTTMKRDLNEISEDLLQIKEELKMFWDDIEKFEDKIAQAKEIHKSGRIDKDQLAKARHKYQVKIRVSQVTIRRKEKARLQFEKHEKERKEKK